MTVSDVGPTTVNKIMELCFKEIGLKKRDLNGQTPFGKLNRHFFVPDNLLITNILSHYLVCL